MRDFIVLVSAPDGTSRWVTVRAASQADARTIVSQQGWNPVGVFLDIEGARLQFPGDARLAAGQEDQDLAFPNFGILGSAPGTDGAPPPPADLGPGELPGEFGADFPGAAFRRGLTRRGEAGSANTILRRILEREGPRARGTLAGSEFAQAFRDPGRAEEIFAPGPRIENFVANVGRGERQQEAARALTTLTGTLGSPSANLDDFINSLVGGVSGKATKFFRPKTSGEFSNAFNLVLDALGGRVNPVFLQDLPFQQNQIFDEFRAQAGLNPQPENTVLNFLRSRLNTARAGL